MIRVAFYKARGNLFDRLIRLWTGSPYSHCELVLGARWITSSPRDGGVREAQIEPDPQTWDFLDVPEADPERIEALFQAERGAGYDWLGIAFSQVLPLGLESRRRWFCSEFCAQALGLAHPARWSPGGLFEELQRMTVRRDRDFTPLAFSGSPIGSL